MPDSLDALAQVKGFSGFGSSMGAGATASEGGSLSFNDAGVRAIQRRECGILVCETEMKWVALRPDPKEYTFYQADRIVDRARDNHMLMRGHTLLWNQPHPGYTPDPFVRLAPSGTPEYPWHRYFSDSDAIWLAIELHPIGA
jgi:GH35 family endo-1,4-beta-xylanase